MANGEPGTILRFNGPGNTDPDGVYDDTTRRLTFKHAGLWKCELSVYTESINWPFVMRMRKNGTINHQDPLNPSQGFSFKHMQWHYTVSMNGTTDWLTMELLHTGGVNRAVTPFYFIASLIVPA